MLSSVAKYAYLNNCSKQHIICFIVFLLQKFFQQGLWATLHVSTGHAHFSNNEICISQRRIQSFRKGCTIFGTNQDMGILKGLQPSLANCLARTSSNLNHWHS